MPGLCKFSVGHIADYHFFFHLKNLKELKILPIKSLRGFCSDERKKYSENNYLCR